MRNSSLNQYEIGIIMEQLKLLLAYHQDKVLTNAVYYDQIKTRVDVVEHIGVLIHRNAKFKSPPT
jgi:hypothetical protein